MVDEFQELFFFPYLESVFQRRFKILAGLIEEQSNYLYKWLYAIEFKLCLVMLMHRLPPAGISMKAMVNFQKRTWERRHRSTLALIVIFILICNKKLIMQLSFIFESSTVQHFFDVLMPGSIWLIFCWHYLKWLNLHRNHDPFIYAAYCYEVGKNKEASRWGTEILVSQIS